MITVIYNGESPRRAFGREMKTGDTFGGLTVAEADQLLRNSEFEKTILGKGTEPTFMATGAVDQPETIPAPPKATTKRQTTKPKASKSKTKK